jgi:hypothetical protein
MGFIWLRIRTSGGLSWVREWTLGFYKVLGVSWVVEVLLASNVTLCSVELISVSLTLMWKYRLCVGLKWQNCPCPQLAKHLLLRILFALSDPTGHRWELLLPLSSFMVCKQHYANCRILRSAGHVARSRCVMLMFRHGSSTTLYRGGRCGATFRL